MAYEQLDLIEEVTRNDGSKYYEISNIDFADGIELYKSTIGNNYVLEKTLTKTELSKILFPLFSTYILIIIFFPF